MRHNYRISHCIIGWFNTYMFYQLRSSALLEFIPLSDVSISIGTVASQAFLSDQLCPTALIIQVLKAGNVSYQLYIMLPDSLGFIPREHTYKTCITWMHCKSLWIKASAKCINVNVNISITSVFWILHSTMTHTNQDEEEGADFERNVSNLDAKRKEEVN